MNIHKLLAMLGTVGAISLGATNVALAQSASGIPAPQWGTGHDGALITKADDRDDWRWRRGRHFGWGFGRPDFDDRRFRDRDRDRDGEFVYRERRDYDRY
ncbi:MAG: hypothetical protein JO273_22145 [Methylobacteriaceae bacterium]|nr:hypothetical protein [Methylobacteriaceae bacterium]